MYMGIEINQISFAAKFCTCMAREGDVWLGGVCVAGGHVGGRGMCGRGMCGGGVVHGRGSYIWQERRPLQWAVCILLECILVFYDLLLRCNYCHLKLTSVFG